MASSYEEYEKQCEIIRAENKELMELFEKSMANLSPKTVRRHLDNVELLLDYYLLREDANRFDVGCTDINGFMSFCIYKYICCSADYAQQLSASIKKFYKCMYENGKIDRGSLQCLLTDIKLFLPEWKWDAQRSLLD
jgi:hypothetical protein